MWHGRIRDDERAQTTSLADFKDARRMVLQPVTPGMTYMVEI
jgi:hypothetical protein